MRARLDRWDWLFALIATTFALGPWALYLRGFLHASVVAVHRSAGDIQYLPLVAGLANFELGDHQVWESRGEGLCSFPLAALLPHAVGLRLFGAPGLALVDALAGGAYFLIGRWLFVEIGLERRWASWLSLMNLLLGLPGAFIPFHDLGFPLAVFPDPSAVWPLSPFRFPRPFVTDLFVLLAMASLVRFVAAPRLRDGVLAGAMIAAALLQSDIYSATAVLPLLLAAAAGRLLIGALASNAGKKRLFVFVFAFGALVLPFMLQRLFEHPDVPRRFGVRPATLADFPMSALNLERLRAALLATALVLSPLLLGRVRRHRDLRRMLPALACLFAVVALASLSRSLFVLGAGQIAQPYHFDLLHERFLAIAIFATLALLLQVLVTTLARLLRRHWRDRAALVGSVLSAVLVLTVAWRHVDGAWHAPLLRYHVRSDFFHYRELGPDYLRDFYLVTRELRRRAREGLRVIATLDHELAVWWVTFQGGALLNPDPFATPLPAAEIERRLVALGSLLGLDEYGFLDLLTQANDPQKNNRLGHNNIVTNFFFSHARYSAGHTWILVIPREERRRLMKLYRDSPYVDYRVDAVVLFARGSLAELGPDPERFTLAFENPTFRVYVASR